MTEEKGSDELLKELEGDNVLKEIEDEAIDAEEEAHVEERETADADPLDDGTEPHPPEDVDPPDDESHPEFDTLPPSPTV